MNTLADMRTQVRSRIDEPSQAFWENSELDTWIYEATREIARRGEILQDVQVTQCVIGIQQYDAPTDMIRFSRAEYVQAGGNRIPLEYRPLHEMDNVWYQSRTLTQGTPTWFSWWGFPSGEQRAQIYLYPSPSDTGQFALFYYRMPHKPVEDDDLVEIPAGWEDLVPLYAEIVARRKDNDRRWQEAAEIFEAKLGQLLAVTRQPSDQMTHVVSADTGWPGWAGDGLSDWY